MRGLNGGAVRLSKQWPRLALLAVVAAAAALVLTTSGGRADPALDIEEQSFFTLINDYRSQNGKVPLLIHPNLNEAADWFATDMADNDYFASNHVDSLGRTPTQRAHDFGYPGSVGENLAAGFSAGQSVFTAWMGSPGHNSNMLGDGYRVIGIGRAYNASSTYHWYWVTDFGSILPSTATPTPTPTPIATPTPAPTPPLTPTPAPTPTATPTQTPAPTPTATPTPTPTPSPAPTPTPSQGPELVFGDVDCGGSVNIGDAQKVARSLVGLPVTRAPGCPGIGSRFLYLGRTLRWGDADCGGSVNIGDADKLARVLIALPMSQTQPCPAINEPL